MGRNKCSLRSRSARIPQSPWWGYKCPRLRCVFGFWSAVKVLWILWLLLFPVILLIRVRTPQWWCVRISRPSFYCFQKTADYYGTWGHGVDRILSYLWIRIALPTGLDRAIFFTQIFTFKYVILRQATFCIVSMSLVERQPYYWLIFFKDLLYARFKDVYKWSSKKNVQVSYIWEV